MAIFSFKCSSLAGDVKVPSDKSISHRSLMLASIANGTSKIEDLLEGEDVIATANALKKMGVEIQKNSDNSWVVQGVSLGGFKPSAKPLDMGNAGTGARLMMGLVASSNFDLDFTGDESLCSRPMARVLNPLQKMGVEVIKSNDGKLPLTIKGCSQLKPINYKMPVASAQVKSAILLASLNVKGKTQITEKVPTRDHTERMLKGMGANINVSQNSENSNIIEIEGGKPLNSQNFTVPCDPSSAAFVVVAAIITKNSQVTIKNVCCNPTRFGLFDVLIKMGANIEFNNKRLVAGEDVIDITAKSSDLKGIIVPAEVAPSMIDEYPILSIAASVANGETTMQGLHELKVKESDRLSAIVDGLKLNKVDVSFTDDSITINGGNVLGGKVVETHMDHRIAMSFLIMGMISQKPVGVDSDKMIETSFPGFVKLINKIGGDIR